MDLSVYTSPTPRLELKEDYQAGLQSLTSIKNFFNSILDNLDNLKENYIFLTLSIEIKI